MVDLEMHVYAVTVWDGDEEPRLLTHLRNVGKHVVRGPDNLFAGVAALRDDYRQTYYFARGDVAWSGGSYEEAEDQYIVALAAWRLS